jgi:hypothetical protein
MQPIELRVNRCPAERFSTVYYTVDKVWPGVGNVSFGQLKFIRYDEAVKWAKTEWPGVPLIRNY